MPLLSDDAQPVEGDNPRLTIRQRFNPSKALGNVDDFEQRSGRVVPHGDYHTRFFGPIAAGPKVPAACHQFGDAVHNRRKP